MPLPNLDENGFLPAGFHACTLREVHTAFCYTPHRRALFGNLLRYFRQWTVRHLHPTVYVDGGFCSRKVAPPKDIDVVIDIQTFDLRDPIIVAAVHQLLNHDEIEIQYGIEVFAHHPALVPNDFRLFFQYLKAPQRAALGLDDGFRKGILQVQI